MPRIVAIDTTTLTPTTTTPEPIPAPEAPSPARARAPRPRRGRRAWWFVARAVIASVVVLGVVMLASPGMFGAWHAHAGEAVPRMISLPWRWQANALTDPPGLASVLATPRRTAALTVGDDGPEAEQVQIIGRNGVYRAIYPGEGTWDAGATVHLSPDGRRLAMPYLYHPRTAADGPTLVDLVTGDSSVIVLKGLPAHTGLEVLGWRPDGGALLLATANGPIGLELLLADIGARTVTSLAELPETPEAVAFSPDGSRVAFSVRGLLRLVDDRGTPLWTTQLTDGERLAGGGAFTPDGERIAVTLALPCPDECAGAVPWLVTYVDSTDGKPVLGPALPTIEAAAIRAVGWSEPYGNQPGGLVIVRYLPPGQTLGETSEPATVATEDVPGQGPADLYLLSSGEQPKLLLDAPYEVADLDVAADLVRAGRFEGTPSAPSLLPIEPGRVRPIDVIGALGVIGALATVVSAIVGLTGRLRLTRLTRLGRRRPRGARA